MCKPRVLIIDDDPAFQAAVRLVLQDIYEIKNALTAADGMAVLAKGTVNTVLLDLNLPDASGLDILDQVLATYPGVPVVMITATDKAAPAVQAVRKGAFHYVAKPLNRDDLLAIVRNAVSSDKARRERDALLEEALDRHALIGPSRALAEIQQTIKRVAVSNLPVLITGETGTGKDLVAHQLHYYGPRAGGKFLSLNMATVPDELLESELFGHEKGAYTNALTQKKGLFEIASGGTLLLDEIGLVSKRVQGKLLHAIEKKEFMRVGATDVIEVDVRIVAATNRNLSAEVAAGNFLPDLYHRLNVFPIFVPPLRERPEDIVPIAEHYLRKRAMEGNRAVPELSAEACRVLLNHPWTGNVRELTSVIDRVLMFINGPIISENDLVAQIRVSSSTNGAGAPHLLKDSVRGVEREQIMRELIANNYNVTRAANALGIHRVTLHRRIKDLGLDHDLIAQGRSLSGL